MRAALKPGNRLLAALTPDDLVRVSRDLEPIALPLGKTLWKLGTGIQHVYFPERGMVSMVAPFRDGAVIEVGLIGREGCVGSTSLHGVDTYPAEAVVQIAGAGLRIGVRELRREARRSSDLMHLLLRFTHALHVQIAHIAACNGRHALQERLARWLLATSDCIESDVVPLTHEFLSIMLGARRAGITVALGTLREAGIVRSAKGSITIIDRPGLEGVSCECHQAVRDEYARLLP